MLQLYKILKKKNAMSSGKYRKRAVTLASLSHTLL